MLVRESAWVTGMWVQPTEQTDYVVGGAISGHSPKFNWGSIFEFRHATVSGVHLGEMELSLLFKSQTEPLTPKVVSNLVFFFFWCKSVIIFQKIWTCSLSQATDNQVIMIHIFYIKLTDMVHVFVQRDKEELREATALLTAQQTSLEIIVNMCCSDGECCGHGKQCCP